MRKGMRFTRFLKDKGITYIKANLSKWKEKPNHYDIVVSNMVFMDIPDYKSAIANCIDVLKQKGLFVFSISHPCFDVEEGWEEKPYVTVKNYFKEYKIHNYIGYSFHHMLSEYINFVIEKGCIITKCLNHDYLKRLLKTINITKEICIFQTFYLFKR